MLKAAIKMFSKFYGSLMQVMSELEGRVHPYTGLLDFFENDRVIELALILQNTAHPKNHHRTEAIKNKEYIELLTHGVASEYMSNLLQSNLTIQVLAVETEILAKLQALAQAQGIG